MTNPRNIYELLGLQPNQAFNQDNLRKCIESIVDNQILRRDLVSRIATSSENVRGVFGELLFWHLLRIHDIELEPTGAQPGAPDFKIVGRNTYLEVTKPFISNLEQYRDRIMKAQGSIEHIHAVQQQEMTNPINKKFNEQLSRWHNDREYIAYQFYLCLDLADFSPIDMAGHSGGGLDTVGRLLYGLGNVGVEYDRNAGEAIDRFINDMPEFTKDNGAPIQSGLLYRKKLPQLVGVLTVDYLGEFRLYKNTHATVRDDTFECDWVEIISDPTMH